MITVDDILSQLQSLLPPAPLWGGDEVNGLLSAVADEFALVRERASQAIFEMQPNTASETIPDWEDELGLDHTGSIAAIIEKETVTGRPRDEEYKIKLAPILGLDPEEVVIVTISTEKAEASGDPASVYNLMIHRDPLLGAAYDYGEAHAFLRQNTQAHVLGSIFEKYEMKCEDATTLCDRDLLEV